MTRATYCTISQAKSWNSGVMLDNLARRELIWWIVNIEDVLGFTMKIEPSFKTLSNEHILHGEASGTGMFLGKIRIGLEISISQLFTEEDASRSSTYRDIMVFWKFYIKTNLDSYRNSSILCLTDSKAAEHI